MTARSGDAERRLLPRWRPWRTAVELGEVAPVRPERPMPQNYADSIRASEQEWTNTPDRARALELLFSGIHIPPDESIAHRPALEAAAQQIEESQWSSSLMLEFVNTWRSSVSAEQRVPAVEPIKTMSRAIRGERVHAIRSYVHEHPRNALARVDLARAFFALDEDEKSEEQLRIALRLDADNRFIVRSAARFYVDVDEERSAADVVAQASGHLDDPWLLSVAVGLRTKDRRVRLRNAIALANDKSISPWHTSELSASLASQEFEHGNSKRGRQLLRDSMIDPTENVAAHIEWARGRGIFESDARELPLGSYEALARRHAHRREWVEAVEGAWGWLDDEPFSADASIFGSLYAIEAGEYQTATEMIDLGLIASPENSTLINNRAFAKACTWDLQEAAADIQRIDLHDGSTGTLGCALATTGLIVYRSGLEEDGRRLYERSISFFTRHKDIGSAARAAMNLAGEDIRSGSAEVSKSIKRAEKLVGQAKEPVLDEAWAKLLDRKGLGYLTPVGKNSKSIDPETALRLPLLDPNLPVDE